MSSQFVGTDIYVNRGDRLTITIKAGTVGFKAGDTLKFSIVEAGDYSKVMLQKTFTVTANAESYDIDLTSEDTKLGDILKKGTRTYWYEVELNGYETLLGWDAKGAKKFTIWPEAADKQEVEE